MRKSKYIVTASIFLLLVVTIAILAGCAESGGDTVERFASATMTNGDSIAVPGYDLIEMTADSSVQKVRLTNPPENACSFILSLVLEDGTVLWTGEALSPGEAFTGIKLDETLKAGNYNATLKYTCISIDDNTQLNGAEIKLVLEVK